MINRNIPSSLVLAPAACLCEMCEISFPEMCDCEDHLCFRCKSASLW